MKMKNALTLRVIASQDMERKSAGKSRSIIFHYEEN